MSTEKVHFTKEKETMLLTLWGRAAQSQWHDPILRDPWAEDAVRHIDYDFAKMEKMGGPFAPFVARWGSTIIATRAATFDMLTRGYLADHSDTTVLHLGCGMDSRVFRVNPPDSVAWYDVDYPDVIDVRRSLFPERPAYQMIGSPLDDLRWLSDVPGDHPGLMIAEGVLPYLTEGNVKTVLNALTHHFPSGQMVFDAMPKLFLNSASTVANTGASYRWALDNPQDIKRLEPKLELVKEFRMHELVGYSRFALPLRAMYRVMEISPALRRADRIVIYRF
jgi:O-methyltransferase involved in polyketide biosynthesis